MDRLTLARPYARAFHACARQERRLDDWERFLAEGAALVAERRVAAFLDDPRRAAAEKSARLAGLLGLGAGDSRGRALDLLLGRRRLGLLAEIREEFRALRARDEGWIEVEVRAARATDPAALDPLARALAARFGRTPRLRVRDDPALLAGVVVRAGDSVLDLSLRGRLERLAAGVS